ncbi:hypothetical protein TWF970_002643 [Orbilia oligospora]|uniref:Uncharacterized protein n=1 Tax=Orbilia oligospora TaxID=2813651 RepID=A0A7C8VIV1_ORBOL|nr:hypothetical protein TWF970_002643 [Orbilia oligospora]
MNPLLRPRFGMLSHRFEAFAIYAPLLRWERAAWRVLREYNDVPSMKPERPPETIGEVPVRSGKRGLRFYRREFCGRIDRRY